MSKKISKAPEAYRIPAPLKINEIKASPITTGFSATVGQEPSQPQAPLKAKSMFGTAIATAAAAAITATGPKAAATKDRRRKEKVPEKGEGATLTDILVAYKEQINKAEHIGRTERIQRAINVREGREPTDHGYGLYDTPVPNAYVPQTRRGFSKFIKEKYRKFILPEGTIEIPKGETYYPYQRFIRDYMRQESPYRGVLVYHGLGSGKTCTSIATAEALFSSANKKIIVMANKSLKKNFFKEITKCGFRHFQLNNVWIPLDPKDETVVLFANQVLGISPNYIQRASNIWVPDFTKGQDHPNFYTKLTPEQRNEIRAQILSVLEWHPTKNPTGRIRFIAYNGIPVKQLMQMACDPEEEKFFDNAVIVIDEIHNLIRNIQGKIEPYLTSLFVGKKKPKRIIPVELVKPAPRWKPGTCDPDTKLYTRAYLFYRLLVEAQNSKIIGLSGTPLINFPEELGILANVLHGYITVGEALIEISASSTDLTNIEKIAHAHPYIDFVRVKQDVGKNGVVVEFTLLPAGIRKISNDEGVERIPADEPLETLEAILASIKTAFKDANYPLKGDAITLDSEPLLPAFGDSFNRMFIDWRSGGVKNNLVLVTRLTGLISYYKGSQLSLMPRVIKDEVVRVPYSLYAQKIYSARRAKELGFEQTDKKKEKKKEKFSAVWAKVYEMDDDTAITNNYKMASRQACNFAFPPGVTRPGSVEEDELRAVDLGGVELGDVDIIPEDKEEDKGEDILTPAGEMLAFDTTLEDQYDEKAAYEEERAIMSDIGLIGDEEDLTDAIKGGGWSDEELDDESEDEDQEGGSKEGKKTAAKTLKTALDVAAEITGTKAPAITAAPKKKVQFAEKKEEAPAVLPEASGPAASPNGTQEPIRFGGNLKNEYILLSNTAKSAFQVDKILYITVENYYQSMKFKGTDPEYEVKVRSAESGEQAKLLGTGSRAEKHAMRPDFNDLKDSIMKTALKAKFDQNDKARDLLISTKGRELINATDKDYYWGEGKEKNGFNFLGKFLMELRDEYLGLEEKFKETEELLAKPVAPAKTFTIKRKKKASGPVAGEAVATTTTIDCLTGMKPGEKYLPDYKEACARAKECLRTTARQHMVLGGPDGLEVYSPKYAAMLKKINEAPGSSLVYSQFLDMEGIGIFRIAMEANGFAPIELVPVEKGYAFSKRTEESFKKGPGGQQRFITFSGGEDDAVRGIVLDLFNARFSELPASMANILKEAGFKDNMVGEICRVFCITSAGAEGLSLRNVRAVHIMEPYWNEVRLRQVKGRAIRIGSHLDLPEADRNVSIYTYVSVFPEEAQRAKAGDYLLDETLMIFDSVDVKEIEGLGIKVPAGLKTYVMTTDEMLYAISERKRKVIHELEGVMKSAAVDCELNEMQNKEGEEPVKCLPLTGKIGDFLYHPRLDVDISEAQKFYIRPTATAAPSGPTVASGAAVASGPLAVEDDLATLEAEIAALEGQAAPVQAAPVQAVPVQAAPVQAAPVQAAPVKAKAKVIARHLPPETVMKKYEGTTYAFAPIKDANQVTTGFRMLDPKTGVHVGYASIKNGVPATPIDLLPNQAKK